MNKQINRSRVRPRAASYFYRAATVFAGDPKTATNFTRVWYGKAKRRNYSRIVRSSNDGAFSAARILSQLPILQTPDSVPTVQCSVDRRNCREIPRE